MNFFEHQHQARRQSKKLIGFFSLAVVAIVVLINLGVYFGLCLSNIYCTTFQYYWLTPLAWWITGGTVAIIVLTSLIRWAQLKRGGGFKAVQMAGATKVKPDTKDPKLRVLNNVVEEMSIAAGVPVPAIFIMENETAINAFVAGTEPHNTCLCVTRGAVDKLTRQELQGVIGHEYSHIFNGDMKINIYLIGILAGILIIGQLGEFLTRSGSVSSSSRRNGGQAAILGLAIMVVGYAGLFFGRLIKSAISRQREFLADASAVQYTRDKDGIANALYKIQTDYQHSWLSTSKAEELSHMCFEQSHKIKFFSGLLATHPPIEKRIKKIQPNFIPSKPEQKQSQSEQSESATSSNRQASAEAAFTNTVVATSILSSVGQIDPAAVDKTQWQISLLPENLKLIARGQDNQITPAILITSLLIIHNTLPRLDIIEFVRSQLSEEQLNHAIDLLADLSPLNLKQHYLLLELALPRMNSIEENEKQLWTEKFKRIIDVDKKVSVVEYIIFLLVKRSMTEDEPFTKKINSYQTILDDLSVLLSSLIAFSKVSDERRTNLFNSLMQSFGANQAYELNTKFNANQFHRSLHRVANLNPLLKQGVLEALVACVSEDNKVCENEFILLRAICNVLDCPIPEL
ncbi:MAG: M48 family metalloprotease [Gammaproteobacteria bacterium]|nr:M48 family metalloprotease [Gammaproteobacteria bacterium]